MARKAPHEADRLLCVLKQSEGRLCEWIELCRENALLFLRDPVAALRASNPDVQEDVLHELAAVMKGIEQKVRAAS